MIESSSCLKLCIDIIQDAGRELIETSFININNVRYQLKTHPNLYEIIS